jgi:hypothetical protein
VCCLNGRLVALWGPRLCCDPLSASNGVTVHPLDHPHYKVGGLFFDDMARWCMHLQEQTIFRFRSLQRMNASRLQPCLLWVINGHRLHSFAGIGVASNSKRCQMAFRLYFCLGHFLKAQRLQCSTKPDQDRVFIINLPIPSPMCCHSNLNGSR